MSVGEVQSDDGIDDDLRMATLEDVAREICGMLETRTATGAIPWTTAANSCLPVSILHLDGLEPLEFVFTKLPSHELMLNIHFDQMTLAEWRFNAQLELQRSDVRARGWSQQIMVMQLLLLHSWLGGIDATLPADMPLADSWQYVVAGMSQLFAKHVADFWLGVCGEASDGTPSTRHGRLLVFHHLEESGDPPDSVQK